METRANYVIVGIFTLVAILAAFGFVYWTAAIGDRGETVTLRVRIPGSASGLGRGSFVMFNGVKVGDVRRVFIDVKNPTVAIADAEVDRLTPLTKSTQADIGLAGLTGQANVELKGGDPSEPNLLTEAEQANRIAEITANPSAVTNLLQTAQDIFGRADKVLTQLEGFSTDVRAPLTETVQNAAAFSKALGENAEGIDRFLDNVTVLSGKLGDFSDKLDGTIQATETLIRSVDPQRVAKVVENVEAISERVRTSSDQFEEIVAGVDGAVDTFNQFASKANGTLDKVDEIVSGVDPAAVRTTLSNINSATADARRAAANVATVTDTFNRRATDFDRIISDAMQISDQATKASVRVNGILVRVDDLLGSGQAEGVIADARATLGSIKSVADELNKGVIVDAGAALKSIRQVADQVNTQVPSIAAGINRFTSQGLGDVRGLVNDGRRSISRIEEAITDLSRNPSRILTGGEGTVRQYDGRSRR